MIDERFSKVEIMYIEKKIAKSLNLHKVIDNFVVHYQNRKIIFV